MQTKIFTETDGDKDGFENDINNFIEDKKIVDIKYSIIFWGPNDDQSVVYSAMIMYEE